MEKILGTSRAIICSLFIVISLIALATGRPEQTSASEIIEGENDKKSLNEDGTVVVPKSIAVNNSTIQATVTLGCGGIISLPSVGSFVVIDYKASVSYANNERCVWTLNNKIGSYRVKPSVRITILLDGFERSYDKLNVLYWNARGSSLVAKTLTNSVADSTNAEAIFLSFHSDGSGVGTGFIARIDLISAPTVSSYGDNFFYLTSSTRTKSYAYGNNAVASILVHPTSAVSTSEFVFSITNLATESSSTCSLDYLEIFEIVNGAVKKRSKSCGSLPFLSSSFRTYYPVIALFASDSSQTGAGFTVTW